MKNQFILLVAFFCLIAFCVWYTNRAACLWALVLVPAVFTKTDDKKNSNVKLCEPTFQEYSENLKKLLVKRYFWSVTDAFYFCKSDVKICYEKGLSVQEAYYKIFDVEQDLTYPNSL